MKRLLTLLLSLSVINCIYPKIGACRDDDDCMPTFYCDLNKGNDASSQGGQCKKDPFYLAN